MTRKEAIEMLRKDKQQRGECFISEAIDMAIEALEQETKTGHWIKMPIGFKCSKCNELEDRTTKYCPDCGCHMG